MRPGGGAHSGKAGKKGGGKGKSGGGKGKGGKGKGKFGKKGMSSVEEEDWTWQEAGDDSGWQEQEGWPEEEPAPEDKPGLGALDLNSLGAVDGCKKPYVVTWKGQDWIRFNYDSGAATTAIPAELASEDAVLKPQGFFKVASGEVIEDYGRAKLTSSDEYGLPRNLTGHLTAVHKPLVSAAEMSRCLDCFTTSDGGVLLPKDGVIAKTMRKTLERLLRQHGREGVIDLHGEGNLYNFYLRSGKWKQVAAVVPVTVPSRSGFPRPAAENL